MTGNYPGVRLSLIVVLTAALAGSGCDHQYATAPPTILPVSDVAITPDTASVVVGAAAILHALLRDALGRTLSGRAVAWSSSDSSKVTVSGGLVTGVAEGVATITATSEGKGATATVSVMPGNVGTTTDSLVIDIASYLGGSAFDHARDVTTDAAGNIYVVGGTMSPNFPTTAGAFQRSHNPGTPSQAGINPMDAFVMKLSPTGQIIWSTLIGGPDYDRAYAVEVDQGGSVYVAGRAGAGFPVTPGAFQTTFRGGQEATFYGPQDGFVCKLDANGSTRSYCSYFGTTDPQVIRDIAIDAAGNAYLASSARQDGLPGAWFTSAYQKTRAGGVDGVIAKVNPTGTQVLWATYLGGGSDEGGGENSIRVAANGNIYFLQNTQSSGMPTPGGFDHTLGGVGDVYLAQLTPDGRTLLFATYIGGSAREFTETHGLAIDATGNAYVAATTASSDFPTTSGAFQRTYGGAGGAGTGSGTNYPADAAVVKISPAGSLLAGTYLGGSQGEGAEGVAVDAAGNVYVSGGTFSGNFPSTRPPFLGRGGQLDAFVTELDPDFGTLLFSQRIGGTDNDAARALTINAAGSVCVAGEASSANLPLANPLQPAFGGTTDALFLRLVHRQY